MFIHFLNRALVAISAAAVCQSAAAVTQYTVEALGRLPGGHFLDVYALNDKGAATGYGYYQDTNMAFAWQNGQLTSLGLLPGESTSGGHDINNVGVIVGTSGSQPFMWQGGQMTPLVTPEGATYTHANAINDKGQIAGSSSNGPLLWSNGNLSILPTLSGAASTVTTDINDGGTVVGISYSTYYTATPVLWSNGQIQQLTTGGYRSGYATGINASGSVVGSVDLGGNLSQAVRWDNGQLTVLEQLEGINDARAYAINGAGLVVGTSFGAPNSKATLWEGTHAYALDDLLVTDQSWQLWQALDINAVGQIAGWGMVNGVYQSFLLTPVPESSTGSYLLIGLVAMASVRLRHSGRKPLPTH